MKSNLLFISYVTLALSCSASCIPSRPTCPTQPRHPASNLTASLLTKEDVAYIYVPFKQLTGRSSSLRRPSGHTRTHSSLVVEKENEDEKIFSKL